MLRFGEFVICDNLCFHRIKQAIKLTLCCLSQQRQETSNMNKSGKLCLVDMELTQNKAFPITYITTR